MGKGEIISSLGDGQYQVKLIYDTRRIDAEITRLDAAIAAVEQKISGTSSPPVPPLEGKLLELAKLERAALETRMKNLQNHMTAERIISAWCADLTEDLTGTVGTIEVPGERGGGVNIQPGYDNNAVYNQARDGRLQAALAGTPAGTFYNLAMLPGWQKWKPTYRYGAITAISGDTCDVALEDIRSSIEGPVKDDGGNIIDYEGMNVNQTETLHNVDIVYMDINGAAFAVGDRVIVKFINQNWSTPQVIGFAANPKYTSYDLAMLTAYGPLPVFGSLRLIDIYPGETYVYQVQHTANALNTYLGQNGADWTWPSALFWSPSKNAFVYFCTRNPSINPPESSDFIGIFIDVNGQIVSTKYLASMNAYEYGLLVGHDASPQKYYVLFRREEANRKDNWLAILDQNLSIINYTGIGFGWNVPKIVDPFKPVGIPDGDISIYDCASGMARFADGTCLWWRNGWDYTRPLIFKYVKYIFDDDYNYIYDPLFPIQTVDMAGTYDPAHCQFSVNSVIECGNGLLYSVFIDTTQSLTNCGKAAQVRYCADKYHPEIYTIIHTAPQISLSIWAWGGTPPDWINVISNMAGRYLSLGYIADKELIVVYNAGLAVYDYDYEFIDGVPYSINPHLVFEQPFVAIINKNGNEIYRETFNVFSETSIIFGAWFS